MITSATTGVSSAPSQRARILGGIGAGMLEISVFHPLDTAAKRLMVYRASTNATSAMGIIRQGSLYSGIMFAYFYKVLQRGYQYSAQPWIARNLSEWNISRHLQCGSPKIAKPLCHAFAGSIIGVGEIIFLPIDSLKVKSQTNHPLQFSADNFGHIYFLRACYRGATMTALRNCVGAFTLFGGAAFTKEYVLHIEDYHRATFAQHFTSSTLASVASVLFSAPFDVVKARVQRQGGESPRTGVAVARDLVNEEGGGAFFKGSIPKCLAVAPKLMFSYTIANWLCSLLASGSR